MSIESMIIDYIKDTGLAEITEQAGQRGVLFLDENEFIPFADLGYSRRLGFYQKSLFPDEQDESTDD